MARWKCGTLSSAPSTQLQPFGQPVPAIGPGKPGQKAVCGGAHSRRSPVRSARNSRSGVGPQVAENAAATAAFSQDLEALGILYLYVNAPQKLQRGEALLPTGVEEYGNESADAFLEELERQGTDYVDLRPLFEENGIYSNWFFRTDHHWKPEAAFFAWQALTDELEERYGLAADPALTDPANWDTRVLEHFFLGSQGKRVGSLYAGADDITLYTPKFDSELTYSCPAYGFTRIGPFGSAVAVSGSGHGKTPQSLAAPAFTGTFPGC